MTWHPEVNHWLATHHGVVSRLELLRMGCTAGSIDAAVRRGDLVVIFPGAYRSPQWPDGAEQLMVATCLRNTSAIVAFTSAGQLWGFRRQPTSALLHVLVPHRSSPDLPGVVVHRCRRIDPVDIVERTDGVRLTSPPRTLFDSADMLGIDATTSVLEQILDRQLCTINTVVDTARRLGAPGRPGTVTMRTVVRSRSMWREAVQSDLEASVLREIARQRLPAPIVQHRVLLPTGQHVRLDFAWPAHLVCLEVDHPFWHAGEAESHRDKRRDRKLATAGWHSVRITNLDVRGGLAESIADVAMILDRRRAA